MKTLLVWFTIGMVSAILSVSVAGMVVGGDGILAACDLITDRWGDTLAAVAAFIVVAGLVYCVDSFD